MFWSSKISIHHPQHAILNDNQSIVSLDHLIDIAHLPNEGLSRVSLSTMWNRDLRVVENWLPVEDKDE